MVLVIPEKYRPNTDRKYRIDTTLEIFLLFMERWLISVIVFSPAISPRQKFDEGLRKANTRATG